MVTKSDLFVLLITTRYHIAVRDMRIRAMLLLTMFRTSGTPSVQSTRDPYESGGPKPYLAQLCSNLGKIWKKCGQDLRPIWGTHMKQVDKNRMSHKWVAHNMGPT